MIKTIREDSWLLFVIAWKMCWHMDKYILLKIRRCQEARSLGEARDDDLRRYCDVFLSFSTTTKWFVTITFDRNDSLQDKWVLCPDEMQWEPLWWIVGLLCCPFWIGTVRSFPSFSIDHNVIHHTPRHFRRLSPIERDLTTKGSPFQSQSAQVMQIPNITFVLLVFFNLVRTHWINLASSVAIPAVFSFLESFVPICAVSWWLSAVKSFGIERFN